MKRAPSTPYFSSRTTTQPRVSCLSSCRPGCHVLSSAAIFLWRLHRCHCRDSVEWPTAYVTAEGQGVCTKLSAGEMHLPAKSREVCRNWIQGFQKATEAAALRQLTAVWRRRGGWNWREMLGKQAGNSRSSDGSSGIFPRWWPWLFTASSWPAWSGGSSWIQKKLILAMN